MNSLGIRHIALNVRDPQKSKGFYQELFGMKIEWEPDPDNVYLTTEGHDNLALHKSSAPDSQKNTGSLDHLGFVLKTAADVDEAYENIKKKGITIAHEIKTHRDGARCFYILDPDGIKIQLIYHKPIADRD